MAEEKEKESCYTLNTGQDYQEIVSSRHGTNSQQQNSSCKKKKASMNEGRAHKPRGN